MKMLHFFMIWGGWTLGSALLAESAPEAVPAADPKAWSIRTYRLRALDLPWPSLPLNGAGEEQIETFFKRSQESAASYLNNLGLIQLPEGSLAAYDPATQTLAVRTTQATQEIIAELARMERHLFPHYLSVNVHVVEADGDLMRAIVKDTPRQRGHGELWQRMQTLLQSGKAREVSLLHVDTRSGKLADLRRGAQRKVNDDIFVDDFGSVAMAPDERYVGDHLQIAPLKGLPGDVIDLEVSLEHDYAPPTDRWVLLGQKGARRVKMQMTDFHRAQFMTGFTMADGDTHLLSVWKPAFTSEPERAKLLQAAFATAKDVLVLPPLNGQVAELLKAHGEKFLPTPQADAVPKNPTPEGMITRFYRVHLFSGAELPAKLRPAQEVLESAGVPFPKGAAAALSPVRSLLAVRNTPENLELVRKFTDNALLTAPQEIDFTLHVVQADAKTLRDLLEQTRAQGDHTAAWKAVEEAVAQGRAKILSTSWLPTRSGQRANLFAGTDYVAPRPPDFTVDLPHAVDAKLHAKPEPKILEVECYRKQLGLKLEVDPVMNPDLKTMNVSVALDYHYAPPTVRENAPAANGADSWCPAIPTIECHQFSVNSSFIVGSGMMRLLGVWKPQGTPEVERDEVMQAAFLKVDLVKVGK